MNTRNPAAVLGLLLCGVAAQAFSQTPASETPKQAPPSTTVPATAPPATRVDGKLPVAGKESRVLADPTTKLYSLCRTDDEPQAPADDDAPYKPNPKAELMSEEAAKAKGFRASAHKIDCK